MAFFWTLDILIKLWFNVSLIKVSILTAKQFRPAGAAFWGIQVYFLLQTIGLINMKQKKFRVNITFYIEYSLC